MSKILIKIVTAPMFWAGAVTLLSLLVAGKAIDRLKVLRTENVRLADNQTALLSEAEVYRTEAGESAASVRAVTLERDEFKRLCRQQADEIKQLGIRLRDVESYASAVTSTTVEVETVVRDTVRIAGDTVRIFEWADKWVTVAGRLTDSEVTCKVESIDTLNIVVHRECRRFLCFRLGTRRAKLDVASSNPHTTIRHARYVKLEK